MQSKQRILIVEDDALICRSLQRILQARGASVDAVHSGREALKKLSEMPYDRVLCDLMLQDFTGFDLLEDIRAEWGDELVSKTFVLMTAYSSDQVLRKGERYGLPLLRKPFKNLELVVNALANGEKLPEEVTA